MRNRALRIAAGAQNGPFAAAGHALADVSRESVPGVTPEVLSSRTLSLESVIDGSADLAFSYANFAYSETVGEVQSEEAPSARVRAIALLQPATLYFLSAPNSTVRAVADLRARRAGFAVSGKSEALVTVVLRAFGLDPVAIRSWSGLESDFARLLAGDLDAMFVVGTQPSPLVLAARFGKISIQYSF